MDLTNLPIDQLVVVAMLIFARVGACLMIMPGISSARIPMNIRLYVAIAISLLMIPLVGETVYLFTNTVNWSMLLAGIVAETLIGATFGIIAHVFIWALQFMANIIAMSIGFSGQPGISVTESTSESQIGNLMVLAATMLFFAAGLHEIVIRGLVNSYQLIPVSLVPQTESALIDYRDALSKSFLTTLRIASPFVMFAILVNMAVGLINKLTPSIPVYFISLPFVMFGGLLLIYYLMPEILHFFTIEFTTWLERGP